jgi:transcriptional regulator
VHIPPADRPTDDDEWRRFVADHSFGHLTAAGRGRDVPVVVPTQFLLDGDRILLHLAGPNPIFSALAEQPRALLSVAGDWAFIPSAWKAIGDEDPALGIPTTYYGAVQMEGDAEVISEPAGVAAVLRLQLADLQPDVTIADPELAHRAKLRSIRAIIIPIDAVRAKFKYGGNVDVEHRHAVADRLLDRDGPGDEIAAAHIHRR